MKIHRIAAILVCASGLATRAASAATPLVTFRVTSINALLQDVETLSKRAHSPTTKKELLAQLAGVLGVEDVAFLDLTRPAAIALPQDGMMLGPKGFVVAVPVRDGARALDVLATQYHERTVEGNLTVLRGTRVAAPEVAEDTQDEQGDESREEGEDEDDTQPPAGETDEARVTYACVRGSILLVGARADLVRQFDQAAALSAEGLPPGSFAFSMEIEPVAALLNSWLSTARQQIADMPPPPAPPEGAPAAPAMPFDPRKLASLFDLYFGFLHDTIESVSKVQGSIEVSEGYLIVHTRGVARMGSSLAKFIAAQREVGLPAVGRMMPIDASMIATGQLFWTDPSREWMKQMSQRYQAAMADVFRELPEAQRESGRVAIEAMRLWSTDKVLNCMRGDIAFAMDNTPDDMRVLQVSGLSDTPACKTVFAIPASGEPGATSALVKDVLEPENVTTYTYKVPNFKALTAGEDSSGDVKLRIARVANFIISGTDPWASKAIREAATARDESSPGRGGLQLTDLGPFTQRPGIFGRMQMGALMRQASAGAQNPADAPGISPDLIRALEGPAGSIPFAMRFDEGAASAEFAMPLDMLDAFATHTPAPAPAEHDSSSHP